MKISGKQHSSCRVVLADDQREVRSAMRRFMEKDGRFEIVGEVENGAEAIASVRSENPDAMVLDLAMPGVDGLQALTQVMQESPNIRVVVLSSMVPFNGVGPQAVAAGAVAAFDKYTSPKKVIKAIMQSLKTVPASIGPV